MEDLHKECAQGVRDDGQLWLSLKVREEAEPWPRPLKDLQRHCVIVLYQCIYLRAYGRGTKARGKESERHLMDCSCGVIS